MPSSIFQTFCSTSWKILKFSSKKTVSIWVATKKSCFFISFPDFIRFRLWQLGQASSGEGRMASPKQMSLGLVICHGDVTQKTWLRLDGDITATGPENLLLNMEISKKISWNYVSLSFLQPSPLLIPFSLPTPLPPYISTTVLTQVDVFHPRLYEKQGVRKKARQNVIVQIRLFITHPAYHSQ